MGLNAESTEKSGDLQPRSRLHHQWVENHPEGGVFLLNGPHRILPEAGQRGQASPGMVSGEEFGQTWRPNRYEFNQGILAKPTQQDSC